MIRLHPSRSRSALAALLLTAACADTGAEEGSGEPGTSQRAATELEASARLPDLYPGVEPARVMILGLFHFHNPNADYAQFDGIDVLLPERQREIERVTDALAEFNPTRIAVEERLDAADSLEARYRRYRAGNFELTRNETHQLGFRLADRLDLPRVDPIDYRIGLGLDSVMAYAAVHDTAFAGRMQRFIGGITETLNRLQREETIGENLRVMNEPRNLDRAHAPYVDMAALDAGNSYLGARVASAWYERNVHMFGNLSRIAGPGDRVLLIVGQGHAPILRELVRYHPAMELVEPLDYLE